MPPPATHNAAAASDNGIMREYPSLDSYVVIPDKMPSDKHTKRPWGKVPKPNIYTSTHKLVHFHPNNSGPIPSSAFYFQKPQDSRHPVADNDTSAPDRRSNNRLESQSSRRPETQTTSGYTQRPSTTSAISGCTNG